MLSALLCGLSYAEIKMPSVFSDNMLLQRDMLVKVWGKADANAQVDVAFGGQKKSTKADSSGNWSLRLDKMSANKNPQEMTVSENGKVGKVIKNILVGEVWIASGQSNMQWTLKRSKDGEKYINQPENKLIRYFSQNTYALSKTPSFDSIKGRWSHAEPKFRGEYSGVGYIFAEKLQRDLDVPVAIVFGALGASKMIAFIPEDKVGELEYTNEVYKDFIKRNATYSYDRFYAKWEKQMAEWKKNCEEAKAQNKPAPRAPRAPNKVSFLPPFATPCYLYNAIISPIAGYGARGVIWYQGESDSEGDRLKYFGEQFELIVKSWREKFENPDLAFIQVQLASFAVDKREWALTRWKQYLATKTISNCYMANIIDCGEKNDIHPKDKTTVGLRMENIAMYEIYGAKNINAYGPIMTSVKYKGNSAIVSFKASSDLVGSGEARGFEVKVGGKWKKANAEIIGKTIKVSADTDAIEGVRYLWRNWVLPEVWLFDANGLPALSFINQKK